MKQPTINNQQSTIRKGFTFVERKTRRGFTLLELLVVIAIIGILIAMGVVSYSVAQRKGRDSKRRGDMKAIQNALEECYAVNNGNYPSTAWSSGALTCSSQTMMDAYPSDPKGTGTYVYSRPGTQDATRYCHCACLETTGAGNSDASCSLSGSGDYFCVKSLQ